MGDGAGGRAAEDRFRRLFDAHYRVVLAFALRRVATPDDAHDVVADTFAVAWRRLDDVPTERDEQVSWLLATARRVLANLHRTRRRQQALQDRVEVTTTTTVVADRTEASADVDLVRQALADLAEPDREILRLTVWDDLSHAQVAAVLDLTVSAVSVRAHRARRRLADRLEALQDVGGER